MATRTAATATSSVAVPARATGAFGNTWFLVGEEIWLVGGVVSGVLTTV